MAGFLGREMVAGRNGGSHERYRAHAPLSRAIILHGTYRYLVRFPYRLASFPRCSGIIANQYQRNVPPTFKQRALECNISLLRYIK